MLGKLGARLAAPAAAALAAGALIAAASPAQAGIKIGPHQYFTGLVIGKTKLSVIDVACAGPVRTGHPAPGQSVEVNLMVSPVSSADTGGYTGNHATRIGADLVWSNGPVTVVAAIATFTQYSVKMAIPTKIKVPCSGSGVMTFNPAPNPDKSATPATVDVTFTSTGV
jgi:hypothetical protein